MKQYHFLFFTIVFFVACGEDDTYMAPETVLTDNFIFQDDFETNNNDFNELFPADNSRWSTLQQTNPSSATNEIDISTAEFSKGESSLRVLAYQSDSQLSKMDIEKNGLRIEAGKRVIITADFFVTGTASLQDLLLIDLECCSCWDPDVGDNYGSENQCPGVRLMMSGGNDFLSIERGKIAGATLQQTVVAFPRNEWVSVEWQMVLSDNDNGQNSLVINGIEVINENAMNMPNTQIFKDVFAAEGIDFQLQEPTFYERVQIGVTANPTSGDAELYVDNFSIKVE